MYDVTTAAFSVSEGESHTVTERINVSGYRAAQSNEVCTYISLFSDAAYGPAVLAYRAYEYEWPPGVFSSYCPVTFAFANP
jgi:hypothetical protein